MAHRPDSDMLVLRITGNLLSTIPMEGCESKGDLYTYMLSKTASAGQGQFSHSAPHTDLRR